MLTPTRYLWLYPEIYADSLIKRIFFAPFAAFMKKWDFISAQRPDHYIAISKTTQQRVTKYYRRESVVIYPPFDCDYWGKINPSVPETIFKDTKYFLVVSRLEVYKKIDLVISVCNKLKKHLIIAGNGTQLNRLKKKAGETIIFLQNISDQELAYLYQHAQALIVPQEEDFGYAALEAQFFGCPVIAYRKGGTIETVIEGRTGIFFDEQTEKSLTQALAKFHTLSYSLHKDIVKYMKDNLKKYTKDIFIPHLIKLIRNQ